MDSSLHKFQKNVCDMEPHEELLADPIVVELEYGGSHECLPIRVLRVPGGWIYYNPYIGVSGVGVFVPFNNEFQEKIDYTDEDLGHP